MSEQPLDDPTADLVAHPTQTPADPDEWNRDGLASAMRTAFHAKFRQDANLYYGDLLDDMLDQDLSVRFAQLHLHVQDAQVWLQWLTDRRDDVLRAKIERLKCDAARVSELLSIPEDEAQAMIDRVMDR